MKKQNKIGIILRLKLRFKGWCDGGDGVLEPAGSVNGKHVTAFIKDKVSESKTIVNEEYSDISNRLKELNQLIKKSKGKREDKISKAESEIKIANDEITKINQDKKENGNKKIYDALSLVQEDKIVKIKQETRDYINEINSHCQEAKGEAQELIRNYIVNFNKELDFCIYKLTIYWGSLYTKYKKKNKEININVTFLTIKELKTEFNIDDPNPSKDFPIESYDIIDLKSILDVL